MFNESLKCDYTQNDTADNDTHDLVYPKTARFQMRKAVTTRWKANPETSRGASPLQRSPLSVSTARSRFTTLIFTPYWKSLSKHLKIDWASRWYLNTNVTYRNHIIMFSATTESITEKVQQRFYHKMPQNCLKLSHVKCLSQKYENATYLLFCFCLKQLPSRNYDMEMQYVSIEFTHLPPVEKYLFE